jgi:hypothetical protein
VAVSLVKGDAMPLEVSGKSHVLAPAVTYRTGF